MKATGIVRRVDELGRIVLPVELRRTLDISERDPLEICIHCPAKIPAQLHFLQQQPGRIGVSGEECVSEVPERASVRHILTPCTAHGEEGPPSGGPSFL